ncbi:MAG: lipopolysaccharide biosynthesis protein [Phycisphaerales bacterium]
MTIEARKGMVRIFSNYTRLLITLGLGVLLVPLTIRWLGDDAFGIISLLGANIGLAGIFRQIIQMSLVRELGQAYHADDDTFHKSYATICLISLICAGLSVLSFAVVFALIPVFKISDEFINPARWFVVGQGAYTAVMIMLAPILNMYLVKERFIGYNIWYIGVRAGNIASVLILGYVIAIDDPALGLTLHGLTWAGLAILAMLIAAGVMIKSDHRVIPTLRGGDRDARKQVLSTFSWNTGVQIAMNLHEQIPPMLLNLFQGTLINAAWGIGFRFVAYIRMCTTGVQFGSDAVSARMASEQDSELARKKLQRLVSIQTKLTSMIALPAAAFVFVYCWVIFHFWVGNALDDYDTVMPIAVNMARILVIALAARAVSETWLLILYGAGFVRSYAPWIFAGGIFAPIASLILMLTLPDHLVVYTPPTMYALVLLVIHFFGLPVITGKCLHIRATSLLISVLRPALATILAIGCGLAVLWWRGRIGDLGFAQHIMLTRGNEIDGFWVLISMGVFGLSYVIMSAVFVLDQSERQRIIGLIRR